MEAKLESLTRELTHLTDSLREDRASLKNHAGQVSQLAKASAAFSNLNRGPMDHLTDMMSNLTQLTALGLFMKWGVFDHIPVHETITYQTLAEKVGADTSLISKCETLIEAVKEVKLLISRMESPSGVESSRRGDREANRIG